jgi:hypothetical protein
VNLPAYESIGHRIPGQRINRKAPISQNLCQIGSNPQATLRQLGNLQLRRRRPERPVVGPRDPRDSVRVARRPTVGQVAHRLPKASCNTTDSYNSLQLYDRPRHYSLRALVSFIQLRQTRRLRYESLLLSSIIYGCGRVGCSTTLKEPIVDPEAILEAKGYIGSLVPITRPRTWRLRYESLNPIIKEPIRVKELHEVWKAYRGPGGYLEASLSITRTRTQRLLFESLLIYTRRSQARRLLYESLKPYFDRSTYRRLPYGSLEPYFDRFTEPQATYDSLEPHFGRFWIRRLRYNSLKT